MDRLTALLGPQVAATVPALDARHGAGIDTAGALSGPHLARTPTG